MSMTSVGQSIRGWKRLMQESGSSKSRCRASAPLRCPAPFACLQRLGYNLLSTLSLRIWLDSHEQGLGLVLMSRTVIFHGL